MILVQNVISDFMISPTHRRCNVAECERSLIEVSEIEMRSPLRKSLSLKRERERERETSTKMECTHKSRDLSPNNRLSILFLSPRLSPSPRLSVCVYLAEN